MAVYRALAEGTDAKGVVITPEESEKAAGGHRSMRSFLIAFTMICIAAVAVIIDGVRPREREHG